MNHPDEHQRMRYATSVLGTRKMTQEPCASRPEEAAQ